MPPSTALQSAAEDGFQRDLDASFHALRGALTEAFASVGADPQRARELGRELGVNKNLAWRATKIVTARAAVDAVPHVPGAQAFGNLVDALERRGLKAGARDALRRAFDSYRRMTSTHSESRAMLEQLAAGVTDGSAARERREQARRQMFPGLGSIWGVQARTQFRTIVLGPPRADGGPVDVAKLSGLIGLRRMRSEVRWTLHNQNLSSDDGVPSLSPDREPIDPSVDPAGPALLRAFSSVELSDLEMVQAGEFTRWMLAPGPVGKTAARDVVFGAVHRAEASMVRRDLNVAQRFWVSQMTPVQLTQLDVIVHVGHDALRTPSASLRSQLEGLHGPVHDDDCNAPMPLHEEVRLLGRGLASMASLDVPRYGEMLALVAERTGWNPEEFVGYRLALPFPPIPTLLGLCVELP